MLTLLFALALALAQDVTPEPAPSMEDLAERVDDLGQAAADTEAKLDALLAEYEPEPEAEKDTGETVVDTGLAATEEHVEFVGPEESEDDG